MNHRRLGTLIGALIATCLMSASARAAVCRQSGSGQAGYWTFDETSGTSAADSSGNGNTLTYASTPLPLTDVPAVTFADPESLSFDGAASSVSNAGLAAFPAGNTVHTTAAWIKVTSLPVNRAWILLLGNPAAGAEHWLVDSGGVTQFGVWGGTQVVPSLGVGVWHHVAITFDGTTLTGYLDGVSIGGGAAAYNFQGVPLTVAQAQNGENFFNGLVDDLRLYTRVLDAAEIASLAAGDAAPAPPTALLAVPGDTQVTLNWTASTGPGTVVYNVKQSMVPGGSPPGTYTTLASNLSATTYVDTGLTDGTTYYYVVTAVSFGESAPTGEASATPQVPGPRPPGDGKSKCALAAAQAPGLTPLLAFLLALLLLFLPGSLLARRVSPKNGSPSDWTL